MPIWFLRVYIWGYINQYVYMWGMEKWLDTALVLFEGSIPGDLV
jgi:hypothetical protein